MTRLASRMTALIDNPTAAPVLSRLEAGASWADVMSTTGLTTGDLIAVIAADALGDVASMGPPLVQSSPRRPRLSRALDAEAIPIDADRRSKLALAAGLLQIQDFWDASHQAAQAADDLGEPDYSAYWHGIAHRREPDPGNASYWFRRVGKHPVFVQLASVAPPEWSGRWDPARLIALASRARSGSDDEALARSLQRLEMLTLLDDQLTSLGLLDR